MLRVTLLNDNMLPVIVLSVVMTNVVRLCVIVLIVVAQDKSPTDVIKLF